MTVMSYEDIVENYDSPTMVLAGPGAGKTYLLSDRVTRLLKSGMGHETITVVTFGKDASLNMRNELLNPEGHWKLEAKDLPKIATLHSLGFEIIKKSARTVGLRKADLAVQNNKYVKELLYRDAAYCAGYDRDTAISAIDCKAQGDCEPDDEYQKCDVCKKYWEIMKKCNRVDFDDQIIFACRVLEKKDDILQDYQNKAQHLLVDEYQDINAAQHKLIGLISERNREGLFVVGDDAQSIYGFRGASPEYILNFTDYYPQAVTPPLLHSRRCHENILRKAEEVLVKHYEKWSGPYDIEFHRDLGERPYVWQMPSEMTEAIMVARLAKKYSGKGLSVLILAPKKELFYEITKRLSKASVPHICPVSLLPLNTWKRLMALQTVAEWVENAESNFDTRLTIESLINGGVSKIPGAKITANMKPATIAKRQKIEEEIALLWDEVSIKKSLFDVFCNKAGLSDELKKVRVLMNRILDKHKKQPANEPAEFLKTVSMATGSWMKPKQFVEDIAKIFGLLKEQEEAADDRVKLMTMRKAKGLEADVVIMVGLEDDIIPGPNSKNEEEEARIFYVSMTRAKSKLYMLHAFKRPRNISYGPDLTNKKRSRFLDAVGIDSEYQHIST